MTASQIWVKITRNPLVVAAYSAATGAVAGYFQNALTSRKFNLDAVNWAEVGTLAGTAALMAVAHLLAPAPGANPK